LAREFASGYRYASRMRSASASSRRISNGNALARIRTRADAAREIKEAQAGWVEACDVSAERVLETIALATVGLTQGAVPSRSPGLAIGSPPSTPTLPKARSPNRTSADRCRAGPSFLQSPTWRRAASNCSCATPCRLKASISFSFVLGPISASSRRNPSLT